MDNKLNKSQIMMLSLLASLIIITLLSSSSLSPTYLYFVIINILIIALGAEAGLLSASSKSPEGHKKPPQEASTELSRVNVTAASPPPPTNELKKVEEVKKCPSTPSLFFIGGGETEHTDHDQAFGEEMYEDDEGEKEVIEGLSGQELFNKSEMFIGNFYKQLKMQREDSWKRIHGYH